jgi:hypothetical protein
MKRIILVFYCLLAYPVVASHIVGGEFELMYMGNNQYRLNLIYYFDVINNQFNQPPENLEGAITVAIYRKSDNVFMRSVTLVFQSKTRVSYTQPACSNGEIVTDKLIYTNVISLPSNQYNSPEGYYVSWQRCCRNYTIKNIISDEPPPGDPNFQRAAGQTFYLEFPPVVKNGQPFQNSSPRLFPPLNDYACPEKPYYADFAGTDDDGDSLVYSIITPLSTHTSAATPPFRPAPYPDVRWRSPYNLDNIVGGSPDLDISPDGFLTVKPKATSVGLYVFAVKCEEFRDGAKIGEVRRDFQMLVVDHCERAEPPQIMGRKINGGSFEDESLTVFFSNKESRCVEVQVSDPDAMFADDDFKENIRINVIALNFKGNLSSTLPEQTTATLMNGSTKNFQICFDECPPVQGPGPFQVGIVAYDDACSLPLSDTLRVNVYLQPPPNKKARFLMTQNVNTLVPEGFPKQVWNLTAVDDDGNEMDMFAFPEPGFVFAKVGLDFKVNRRANVTTPDTLPATFSWDPKCNIYDFTKKTEFNIRFLVEDRDKCKVKDPDTLDFKLRIKLPGNFDPVISSSLSPEELQNGVTRKVFDDVNFNVSGTDADNDKLVLVGQGMDFNMGTYSMQFPMRIDNGSVSSDFDWEVLCKTVNLSQKDEFPLRFVLIDSANWCGFFKTDTLLVNLKVEPPDNTKPLFTVINTNDELTFADNHQTLFVGQQISLALTSNDPDVDPQDNVTIDIVHAEGNVVPEGYIFSAVTGTGSAETTFTWNTACTIFQDAVYENNYTFRFLTKDDRCFNTKADTLEVDFTIRDIDPNDAAFQPPNIITPNGDGLNEFFAMVRLNKSTNEYESILPYDNCVGRFVSISIYNRWGLEIFKSENREFRWHPQNEAAGVYFYTLVYSDKEYKGSITIRN